MVLFLRVFALFVLAFETGEENRLTFISRSEKEKNHTVRGQSSSLVVHWLSVPGNHGSDPVGGEKIIFFHF